VRSTGRAGPLPSNRATPGGRRGRFPLQADKAARPGCRAGGIGSGLAGEGPGRATKQAAKEAVVAGPVAAYPFERARDAFVEEWTVLDDLAGSLTDEQLLAPSRCVGWAVCDVLLHLDLGAQEILIGLASPTDRPADTDFASYWRKCCGGDEGPDLASARFVRLSASAFARPSGVVAKLHRLIGAARRQAAAVPAGRRLEFQGHVLPAGDFLATWVVEGAVHHLDMAVELPGLPAPAPGALAVVRETLDALLGGAPPLDWDDATYALKGTGRLALSGRDRDALGDRAGRFPLFG
jgi:Mycothiol maleylpyruvate isomerase N-terminal domain